jgi:hypothetical protein
VFCAVGILSLLAVVSVRQDVAGAAGAETGADAAPLVPRGRALVAVHDATFLLGPGFLAPLGNGVLLGYLMYRSGLVPRGLALLGLIGGPLLIVAFVGVLFGAFAHVSLVAAIATIPELVWELSLGIYLVVKGFLPSPILKGPVAPRARLRCRLPTAGAAISGRNARCCWTSKCGSHDAAPG